LRRCLTKDSGRWIDWRTAMLVRGYALNRLGLRC
jgi:hypothetical protein